jgi:hypothetical protein
MNSTNFQRIDSVKITELEEPSKKIVELLPGQNLPESPSSPSINAESTVDGARFSHSNEKASSQRQDPSSNIVLRTTENIASDNDNDLHSSHVHNDNNTNDSFYPLSQYNKEAASPIVTALTRPSPTMESSGSIVTVSTPLNSIVPTPVVPMSPGSVLASAATTATATTTATTTTTTAPVVAQRPAAIGPVMVLSSTALPPPTPSPISPTSAQATSIFFVPTPHSIPLSPLSLITSTLNNTNPTNTTTTATTINNNNIVTNSSNNSQPLVSESVSPGLVVSSQPTTLATKGDQFVDITPYLNLPQVCILHSLSLSLSLSLS